LEVFEIKTHPDLEFALARLLRLFAADIPPPVTQHRFHPTRRWRLDFAWPDRRLGIEVQGGTFLRGPSGHTSGIGVQRDCEKSNALTVAGWRCLKYTTKDLSERPMQVIEEITSEWHKNDDTENRKVLQNATPRT
jgi:very-short-patch-repair endonuclease